MKLVSAAQRYRYRLRRSVIYIDRYHYIYIDRDN